ncbi:MAG: replicative DNA helicase [Selenomonadaceae bacterium]|jgi:replicative DNA helicase|uniref:Replicative DNA helicase n=1 Tax=Selenomonas bovis TaxID=416586 RepID=A0A848B856_9FIRM|nr:replicative DNA helicase [Selenomonas bovis]MBQ1621053.1 replicative DNA helicase [Selenomonas sp.]MDY6272525.1 replicative DNA helicase [Selenomonadaceae bacterium]MCI6171496.1 replicative DNA helicase [Selenomonas bovis]MCI6752022.1 replicative DNA helicase [Selenomonas bovis]MCI7056767.1 replicative DNA helicase [Selenomonas bovis]
MPLPERVPPQNIEAEQSVLGAMLIKKEAITQAQELLRPDDFYREAHRIVFETMLELAGDNEAVDLVTLTEALRKKEMLEKVGGISFITALANYVPTAANIVYHAQIVKEKSELRHLIDAATEIASAAYEATDDVKDIMDDAEKKILAVAANQTGGAFEPIRNIVIDTVGRVETLYENQGGLTGISTGFRDLDRDTSGLQKSDLILVAARPSMGKTAFTLNIATYAAMHGHTVAFFSLEMSKEQLVQRMLCSEGGIDSQRLRTGQLEDADWDRLINTADRVSKASIYIDDTAGINVMDLRSKARRLKAEHGLDLIVIDYLQLMQGRARSSSDNRQQEISEISRSLKALARELDVPVVALSQLSRSVESRTVKKPMLSDLRESGSLEQDADIVMFLYREDYYDQETERKNITEVIIAKHRNGPIGTIELFFQKEFTKFRDLSHME